MQCLTLICPDDFTHVKNTINMKVFKMKHSLSLSGNPAGMMLLDAPSEGAHGQMHALCQTTKESRRQIQHTLCDLQANINFLLLVFDCEIGVSSEPISQF